VLFRSYCTGSGKIICLIGPNKCGRFDITKLL
jgi:hypothetical protein